MEHRTPRQGSSGELFPKTPMERDVAWKIVSKGGVVVPQRVPIDAVFQHKLRQIGKGRRARKNGPYWYARVKYADGWQTVYLGSEDRAAIFLAAHKIVREELSRPDLTVGELRKLEALAYAIPPPAPRLPRMAKGRTIPEAIAHGR